MDSLQTTLKKPRIGWLLAGLYCCCVLIRFLLAWLTSAYPTVRIDEYLYASLARSVATENTLLYLGQPALYNYLVYPLFLAPIYRFFPAGTDYYRLIQLWNILVMSLSVFPVYGLCRGLYGEKKKALWAAALCMLLPDYILGQGIFSEAVIYPLFYALMYCAYKNLCFPRPRYAVWIGVLGGLLYCAKPGAVIPAALALLLTAGGGLRKRSKRDGLSAAAGFACLAAVILFFKALAKYAFGYDGAAFSVYGSQLNYDAGKSYDIFGGTAVLYPYYFLLGCGVLPLMYALQRLRRYRESDRRFLLLALASALLVMTGTAWTVNRPERTDILFMRYADMYLPLVLACSLLPIGEPPVLLCPGKREPVSGLCLFLAAYAAVCTLVAGAATGIGGPLDVHFLFSLSVLFIKDANIVLSAAVLLLCAASLFLIWKNTAFPRMARACCFLFLAVAVLSNYVGYAVTASNTYHSLAAEARETLQALEYRDYLYVYAASRCDYGLDVNSRENVSHVTLSEFAENLRENRGAYRPFLPASSRGMTARNLTHDADTAVFNWKTYPLIQFAPSVSSSFSADRTYMAVRFEKGGRIADCVLTGTKETALTAGKPAELLLLNDAWLGKPVRITVETDSEAAQEITLSGAAAITKSLDAGRTKCAFLLDAAEESYRLEVSESDVKLLSFSVLPTPSE